MLPFLTFASGIIAGIVGVKLLKNIKAPDSLGTLGDKAQAGLRDATVSGLSAIEKSSASLRAKLTPDEPAVVEPAAVPVAKAAPRRKVAAKKKTATAASPVDAKPESDS